MHMIGPPNWVAWVADFGSIIGFIATLVLAVQAWKVKKKYNLLIELIQSHGRLSDYCPQLLELLQGYTVADRATLQRQAGEVVGKIDGELKSLGLVLPNKNRDMVHNLLNDVNAVKKSVDHNTLTILYRELNALVIQLETIVDQAKIDV